MPDNFEDLVSMCSIAPIIDDDNYKISIKTLEELILLDNKNKEQLNYMDILIDNIFFYEKFLVVKAEISYDKFIIVEADREAIKAEKERIKSRFELLDL